jgi:predicted nucleic acid-binding protein
MASSGLPRIFIDANVFFSSVYNDQGVPAQLLQLAAEGRFRPALSRRVMIEAFRNIRLKAPRALATLEQIMLDLDLEVVAEADRDSLEPLRVVAECALFVAAAVAGGVDAFCTGDRRLRDRMNAAGLSLNTLTPRQALELVSSPTT